MTDNVIPFKPILKVKKPEIQSEGFPYKFLIESDMDFISGMLNALTIHTMLVQEWVVQDYDDVDVQRDIIHRNVYDFAQRTADGIVLGTLLEGDDHNRPLTLEEKWELFYVLDEFGSAAVKGLLEHDGHTGTLVGVNVLYAVLFGWWALEELEPEYPNNNVPIVDDYRLFFPSQYGIQMDSDNDIGL